MRIVILAALLLTYAVAEEAKQTTPGGKVTFKVPAGWSQRTTANGIVLTPPETDTHIAIVETTETDAAAAVNKAWREYRPDFKRPFKMAVDRPGRNGWTPRRSSTTRLRQMSVRSCRPRPCRWAQCGWCLSLRERSRR
jgi:hypothetical protein